VLRHNLWYFLVGRNAGLLPYFFPGMLAVALFLFSRDKRAWQWFALGTICAAVAMHVFVWPFTWNGGGGPIGSRYFLAFYPLFLLLVPATAGIGATLVTFIVGALFTAPIVLNPFYASTHAGEHTESAALRKLPIELTLINDLPVAQNGDRRMRPLGGTPAVWAYFPDDNAYNPEGPRFWVKGRSTTEVVLRAPVESMGGDKYLSKAIARLNVEIRNGGVPNRVTVSSGRDSKTFDMSPGDVSTASLDVRSGVPFRRDVQPVSYLYTLSVTTSDGFVPFLQTPCGAPGQCPSDSRFLGAMIHVIPEYTDADISTWRQAHVGTGPRKEDTSGVLDAP